MNLSVLPIGETKPALGCPHFPTAFQAVIWRNWGMVPRGRIAAALNSTTEEILRLGTDLGLVDDEALCDTWLARGYQTIIRLNWHLVTYEQLLILLDWTPEKLAFILREDDFLWCKMGNFKPVVQAPAVRPLTPEEQRRTDEVRQYIQQTRAALAPRTEAPFAFLETIHAPRTNPLSGIAAATRRSTPQEGEASGNGLRMMYSYSALYGDPLMDERLDPFPDNMLDAYAAAGVNALWTQAVLYTLVPWMDDGPKTAALSTGWETRIANLRKLCKRMASRGIRLMLYLNEPRSLPNDFFTDHPDWRGVQDETGNLTALCTSVPEVLERLKKGVSRLFEMVPELGGFFCITMSENLTNCWSRHCDSDTIDCPRCVHRSKPEVIAEVLKALSEGAHAVKPDAEIVAWSWGWRPPWDLDVIARLPKGVKLMCVSETGLPTNVGGIKGEIIDYSVSKPGPGPYALRLWDAARKAGVPCVAKTQFNNSWECSAVPYLPVPDLVEEHIKNLRAAGIQNFMMSWTLGGFPGGNIRLLTKSKEQLSEEDFGPKAAPGILEAYRHFSDAFRHFPFHWVDTIYNAPQNYGPHAQFYAKPTGYHATMIGFPYDDLDGWRGVYPVDVFEQEFTTLVKGWREGLACLKNAEAEVDAPHRDAYEDLRSVAQAAYCHFLSTEHHIRFVRAREKDDTTAMQEILRKESENTLRFIGLLRRDSRLGFEASNHYYYTENTLLEKLLNCRDLLESFSGV